MPLQAVPEWSKSKQAVNQLPGLSVVALMGSITALALLASAVAGGGSIAPAPALDPGPAKAVVAARASVRILPAARVSLSNHAAAQGYRLSPTTITVEDGRKVPAKLVEFQ